MNARVTIRRSVYRGHAGFTVTGPRCRVFTETLEDAEQVKANVKAGLDATAHWRASK